MIEARLPIVLLLFGGALSAHDVVTTKLTWTREISRLVYKRCAGCHHDGGTAFSLMTYEEARPWAKAIKEEVLERRMPPWNAVKGFGQFRNDRGLTQEEIMLVAAWVEGGAPDGEPQYLPPPPDLSPRHDPLVRGLRERLLRDDLRLTAPATLYAIEPASVPPTASVRVVAERPDGSIEPLIWIRNCSRDCDQKYFFAAPLPFPKGTRIRVTPPEGSWRIAFVPTSVHSPAR